MNRRQFVLSWGRKLFFGLAWPLFSLVGLIYLQSFVLPQSTSETLYFLVSFIGHYGLVCSMAYFLIYCPIVLLFPTYYFSRIWSLVIILIVTTFLFLDAYIFSQFRIHLNMFFMNLVYQKGLTSFISSQAIIVVFTLALFVVSIIIWFRGNMTWRSMQKRFSNPVSNWYMVLIFACLGVSHLMRVYSSVSMERMQALFPVSIVLNGKMIQPPLRDVGKLYYPKDELKCSGKGHPNIIFFVVRGWKSDSLLGLNNPQISHLQNHASVYKSHYSGSTETSGGLFSLFYSLPGTYGEAFRKENKNPVFLDELTKRKYQTVSFIQSESVARDPLFKGFSPEEHLGTSLFESWKAWSQGGTVTPPLFAFFYFDINQNAESYASELTRVDTEIRNIILSMLHENILKDTTFVITGDHGPESMTVDGVTEDKLKTPFMVIWPHRVHKEFEQFSSHYDVVPTLMRELWNCKSSFSNYSIGKSLNDQPVNPWHMIEAENGFALLDLQKSNFTRITPGGGFEVRDLNAHELSASKGRTELTLKAIQDIYRFYKR